MATKHQAAVLAQKRADEAKRLAALAEEEDSSSSSSSESLETPVDERVVVVPRKGHTEVAKKPYWDSGIWDPCKNHEYHWCYKCGSFACCPNAGVLHSDQKCVWVNNRHHVEDQNLGYMGTDPFSHVCPHTRL